MIYFIFCIPGQVSRPELPHLQPGSQESAALHRGLHDVRGLHNVPGMLGIRHLDRHEQTHLYFQVRV